MTGNERVTDKAASSQSVGNIGMQRKFASQTGIVLMTIALKPTGRMVERRCISVPPDR